MTVVLAHREPQLYMAMAADTKPTSGVNVGAELLETDTGRTFVFDGSAWSVMPRR